MKIGIYPGTFDPITLGHMDIIKKGVNLVDKLYVAIAKDSRKSTLFTLEERLDIINLELKNNNIPVDKVEVEVFSGFVVDYAKSKSANIIIRGLRALSDFEYEFQMACINSLLADQIQTIFLPAAKELQLVASKFVREIAKLDGDTSYFVSDLVNKKLKEKYKNNV